MHFNSNGGPNQQRLLYSFEGCCLVIGVCMVSAGVVFAVGGLAYLLMVKW